MDNWKVQCDRKILGEIPYHSLPIYRLLGERLGFECEEDQLEESLRLISGLRAIKIYLMPVKQTDTDTFILEKTKVFLTHMDLDVTVLAFDSPLPEDGLVLKFRARSHKKNFPQISILHSHGTKVKKYAALFKQECKKYGFASRIKEDDKSFSISVFEILYKFPLSQERQSQSSEKVSMILASTLLRIITEDNPFLLLPSIAIGSSGGLLPLKVKPESISSKKETNSELPLDKDELLQPKTKEMIAPSSSRGSNPTLLPPFRMEVCFDHQLVFPTSDDDDFLVLATLYLKNTGLSALSNPHICIHVPSSANIKVKGQMVPPKMTDTVGVQSFSGDSPIGWKYVNDDWREKAKEKGEYWVCPIQHMVILPGDMLAFSNLQFFIPQNNKENISIEGAIHFKELNLNFSSSNRISLSFS